MDLSSPQGIFISYRRDDARGASGRVYDWLRIAFGRERVFRDVASIGAGKWRVRIDSVCLPVIGLRWCDDTNGPRLATDGDMVRHEILAALARSVDGLTLIPALVEGAPMPAPERLPAELHELLEWNAFALSESGWEDDMRRLIEAVAQASGLAAAGDVDSLLARAQEAEARMHALEHDRALQADQIRALTDSVHALTRQLAEAPATERAELSEALGALARGDPAAAEAEFERVLQAKSAEANAASESAARAHHDAAEAARHIASLAMLDDVAKALRYYQRAAELEPEDTWTHFCIGDLHIVTGDLTSAMKSYRDAVATVEVRLATVPGGNDARRDLSVSHNRIGDVLVAQGDGTGALAAFRKGLEIAEALAARDPANTESQRDLSISHDSIGDALVAQGDGPGALEAYRKSLAIREALAARDPADTEWQFNVSVSLSRIGDALVAQGDGPGALEAYLKTLTIWEALTACDPADFLRQRGLSSSHDRIGDALVAQGDGPGALAAYRKGLEIAEALAARDPANTESQRGLSISHDNIGDALVAQGDDLGALEAYRKSLAIREALAARDPANAAWQVDVAVSCSKLGTHTDLPPDERRAFLERGRALVVSLKTAKRLAPTEGWVAWFDRALFR